MDIFEISAFRTGISEEGVNYLLPSDSFQNIKNGFIDRQVLQSRKGFTRFGSNGLSDGSRVMGIFQFIKSNNTKETLAISKDYLYRYNEGTDAWIQIPMNSSNAIGTFGIVNNSSYVSGTSYIDSSGNDRFVFCGKELNDIFFYNETDVKRFTNVTDNPDYEAPAAGAINKAWFVNQFGSRINFYVPTIGARVYPQSVLYSGINDSSGTGDKFNSVGSGRLGADTSDYIQGVSRFGDNVIITFNNSSWTLEKTRDPYNPYFIRKISSSIGTTAPFSPVFWSDEIKSLGKEGILSTNARRSLRTDNKIPNFTKDEIDIDNFDLTYGGIQSDLNQFLWSYKKASGDPDVEKQDSCLVNNYEEDNWSIYDYRFSCFGESDNGTIIPWNQIDESSGNDSWAQWNTTEEIWNKIGIKKAVLKTLAGDDNGFIYELNTDNDDFSDGLDAAPAITQASQAVLSITGHSFVVGDKITISGVKGMTNINNFDPDSPKTLFNAYTVTAITSSSITINIDSTEFDAHTGGGLVSKVIEFEAEMIPFNPYRSKGRKCYVSHIEFLIDVENSYLSVDLIADEEKTPFKKATIVTTDTSIKARQWSTIAVNNEAEFLTLVFNQISPSSQLKITNIRIHAEPGGLTSA